MNEKVKGVIRTAIAEFGEQANIASYEARERIAERVIKRLEEHSFLIVPAASSGPFLRKIVDHDPSVRGSHGCGTGG
jgi:hypothetical protein